MGNVMNAGKMNGGNMTEELAQYQLKDGRWRVYVKPYAAEVKEELLDADIEKLIEERQAARKAKNFARADEIRNELVPINKKFPIAKVMESVRNYIDKSNANCGRVTIEYVLLDHLHR